MPVPFLSLLIDDCIDNGRDYNAGGARYNTSYIQGVGLGSMTDSADGNQGPCVRQEKRLHGCADVAAR
jgi:hypothetical protein